MALIQADNATLVRADGSIALRDWNWEWNSGEAWVIVGETGSGKTTFLEAILGRWRVVAGTLQAAPNDTAVLIRFDTPPRRVPREFFYQQRYEFADGDEPHSVQDFVGSDNPWIEPFQLNRHLLQPLVTLSHGQMRKARLAKALAAKPQFLLLDDPFLGLDIESRADLARLLHTLRTAQINVALTCRNDEIPNGFENIHRLTSRDREEATPFRTTPRSRPASTNPIIELNRVSVRHAGQFILSDVSWTVHEGESWALSGPNGAGKTTLLSLLVGDHPQAFSNDVRLFGQRRGSGETLWDIRRRVGFVSPEFHQYFSEDLTAMEAVETGFHDTLLHKPVSDSQRAAVNAIFEQLGLTDLMTRRMRQLSMGQQRLALLVRALVKTPPLVILDEPYQGLDAHPVARLNRWLEEKLLPTQTLIVTTHRREQLPNMNLKHLRLRDGQVDQGTSAG